MSAKKKETVVMDAETDRYTITGSEAALKLTNEEVAALSSSANTKFEQDALEMSKRIEEIANTVIDSE